MRLVDSVRGAFNHFVRSLATPPPPLRSQCCVSLIGAPPRPARAGTHTHTRECVRLPLPAIEFVDVRCWARSRGSAAAAATATASVAVADGADRGRGKGERMANGTRRQAKAARRYSVYALASRLLPLPPLRSFVRSLASSSRCDAMAASVRARPQSMPTNSPARAPKYPSNARKHTSRSNL